MWEYYCEKCKKIIDIDKMELKEDGWQGDWEEFHIVCGSKLLVGLKP